MKLVVKPKTKKQEKIIKVFLEKMDVDFSIVEEDGVLYKTATKKTLSKKEKSILGNLDKSIAFVNNYKKGKTKTKTLKQLLNEL